MSKNDRISMSVIRRLPRYYRFLSELDEQHVERISSTKLAAIMNVTASQVRQDLNCFGGFGQQGYGYDVPKLFEELSGILGLDSRYSAILLGAGNLGRAILNHVDFASRGFELKAVFDKNPEIIGTSVNGITVRNVDGLSEYCQSEKVDAAFLCLPKDSAEQVADILYQCGVRGFWNFSHYDLSMKYGDAVTENVHLNDSLMTLCCVMTESRKPDGAACSAPKPEKKKKSPASQETRDA